MELKEALLKRELVELNINKNAKEKFRLESELEYRLEELKAEKEELLYNRAGFDRILVGGVMFSPNRIADIIIYLLKEFTGSEWNKVIGKVTVDEDGKRMHSLWIKHGDVNDQICLIPYVFGKRDFDFRVETFNFLHDELELPLSINEYSSYIMPGLKYVNYDCFDWCWPIKACFIQLAMKQIENDGKELSYDEMIALLNEYIKENKYICNYVRTKRS